MAYVKNIWVDQDVERPKTYEVTNNQDGSITLTDSFGLVTELGTPVNEVNMNHIEEGIDGCAIRKHNLTETFNLGEWVLGGTGDDEGIYKSLTANNVGNAITDDTAWEKVELGGSSRNVGEIVSSTIPLTDAGLHLLDGSLISGSGSYADFVTYIAGLVTDYPNLFCTEADWQTSVTNYGVCGKFVYDSVNNTVRLPKITGIVEGTTDLTALGDLVEAGLPNIEVTMLQRSQASTSGGIYQVSGAGTFSYHGDSIQVACVEIGNNASSDKITIDASLGNTIYGNSTTVQPQTIKVLYYIVIATTTKTAIQVDIDEIATDLNGKADIDGSNMASSVKNFDGQHTSADYTFIRNASLTNTQGAVKRLGVYDISSALPNDNYSYEVTLVMQFTAPAVTSTVRILVNGNGGLALNGFLVASRSGQCMQWCTVSVPVSSARTIGVNYTTQGGTATLNYMQLVGYRRIGTNE